MASDFDAIMAGADAILNDQFGETITYTPVGGSAVPLTAIVERDRFLEVELVGEGRGYEMRGTVQVLKSELAANSITPAGDDTMTFKLASIDTEVSTWTVVGWPDMGGDALDLEVARVVRQELHSDGHYPEQAGTRSRR